MSLVSIPFDISSLPPNSTYTFTVTPKTATGTPGFPASFSITTAPVVYSAIGVTDSQNVAISISGFYEYINVRRNGIDIQRNYHGYFFLDNSNSKGLIPDTSYIYVITPYNRADVSADSIHLYTITLPAIYNVSYTSDISSITLSISGIYQYVDIIENTTQRPIVITHYDISYIPIYDISYLPHYDICYTYHYDISYIPHIDISYIPHIDISYIPHIDISYIPHVDISYIPHIDISYIPHVDISYIPHVDISYIPRYDDQGNPVNDTNGDQIIDISMIPLYDELGNPVYDISMIPLYDELGNPVLDLSMIPLYDACGNPVLDLSMIPLYDACGNPVLDISMIPLYDACGNPVLDLSMIPLYDELGNPVYDISMIPLYDELGNPVLDMSMIPLYDACGNHIYDVSSTLLFDASNNIVYDISYILRYDSNGNPAYDISLIPFYNNRLYDNSYTDVGNLTIDTGYSYTVTPYNFANTAGVPFTLHAGTLPIIYSINHSYDASNTFFSLSGNYSYVSISRNGRAIGRVYGSTFLDNSGGMGIQSNTQYTYTMTPINNQLDIHLSGHSYPPIQITTLPRVRSIITQSDVSSIRLVIDGSYDFISIENVNNQTFTTLYNDISFVDTYSGAGLLPDTSYVYLVIPYNSQSLSGEPFSTSPAYTVPILYSVSSSYDDHSVTINISGSYYYTNIFRNNVLIADHLYYATSYVDISGELYNTGIGLKSDTVYNYSVVPYGFNDVSGSPISFVIDTLPILYNVAVFADVRRVVLNISGVYNYVNIFNVDTHTLIADYVYDISQQIIALSPNTPYNFSVVPYNTNDISGVGQTISVLTRPTIYSINYTSDTSSVSLTVSGSYSYFDVIRDNILQERHVTGTHYTDNSGGAGLMADISVNYTIIPFNDNQQAGPVYFFTIDTLPIIYGITSPTYSAYAITLNISGYYETFDIYRDGSLLSRRYPSKTYLDTSGLIPNVAYTYTAIPYNYNDLSGAPSPPFSQLTLPAVTKISTTYTTNSVTMNISGGYYQLTVARNGIPYATIYDNIFSDVSCQPSAAYSYLFTPYNSANILGNTYITNSITLPSIYAINYESTANSIILQISGAYAYVDISRNSLPLTTRLNDISYTDNYSLIADTSYSYTLTPYNNNRIAGNSTIIVAQTHPLLYQVNYSKTTSSSISLSISGLYNYVAIDRNGVNITNAVYDISYTDYDVVLNTDVSYIYTVTPYNLAAFSGNKIITSWVSVLPYVNFTGYSNISTNSLTVNYTGQYYYVRIARNTAGVLGFYETSMINDVSLNDYSLLPNKAYRYYIIAYNRLDISNSTTVITPLVSSIASVTFVGYTNITYTSVTINYSNASTFAYVSIARITNEVMGTYVDLSYGVSSYTDISLSAANIYAYSIVPKNAINISGSPIITGNVVTYSNVVFVNYTNNIGTSLSVNYTGNYSYIRIARNSNGRNGTNFIQSNVGDTSFNDTLLTPLGIYSYTITPYNIYNVSGATITTPYTSNTANVALYGNAVAVSATSVSIPFSGNFYNLSIFNQYLLKRNVTNSPFLFTGLLPNTSYTFSLIPYNSNNVAGTIVNTVVYTWGNTNSLVTTVAGNSVAVGVSGTFYYVVWKNTTTGTTGNSYANGSSDLSNIVIDICTNIIYDICYIPHYDISYLPRYDICYIPHYDICYIPQYDIYGNVQQDASGNTIYDISNIPLYDYSGNIVYDVSYIPRLDTSGNTVYDLSMILRRDSSNNIVYDVSQIPQLDASGNTKYRTTTVGQRRIIRNNFVDTSGIKPNTPYNYTITPYNIPSIPATGSGVFTQTIYSGATINSAYSSSVTAYSITLTLSGIFSYINWTNNVTQINGSSAFGTNYFTDTSNIMPNTLYNYTITPCNGDSVPNTSAAIIIGNVYTWGSITNVYPNLNGTLVLPNGNTIVVGNATIPGTTTVIAGNYVSMSVSGTFDTLKWTNITTGTTQTLSGGVNTIIDTININPSTNYTYQLIPYNVKNTPATGSGIYTKKIFTARSVYTHLVTSALYDFLAMSVGGYFDHISWTNTSTGMSGNAYTFSTNTVTGSLAVTNYNFSTGSVNSALSSIPSWTNSGSGNIYIGNGLWNFTTSNLVNNYFVIQIPVNYSLSQSIAFQSNTNYYISFCAATRPVYFGQNIILTISVNNITRYTRSFLSTDTTWVYYSSATFTVPMSGTFPLTFNFNCATPGTTPLDAAMGITNIGVFIVSDAYFTQNMNVNLNYNTVSFYDLSLTPHTPYVYAIVPYDYFGTSYMTYYTPPITTLYFNTVISIDISGGLSGTYSTYYVHSDSGYGYNIYVFTAGTSVIKCDVASASSATIYCLCVGGGGGGGSSQGYVGQYANSGGGGGGGGGGGVVYTALNVPTGKDTITVSVGQGGAGGLTVADTNNTNGFSVLPAQNGQNSTILFNNNTSLNITAFGGGAGSTVQLLNNAAPSPYSPNAITSATMLLWFDASDYSTIQLSGSNVTQWNDKSGNNRHATRYGSDYSTYNGNGFGGYPTINFGSTSGGMSAPLPQGTFPVGSGISVFAAFYTTGSSNGAVFTRSYGNVADPIDLYNQSRWSGNAGNYTAYTSTIDLRNINSPCIYDIAVNSSNWYEWVNGGQQSWSTSSVNSNFYDRSSDKFFLGARWDHGTTFTGNISELLVFQGLLTTSDRQTVEGYMAWKWGVNSQLPSSHPYYNYAPSIPNYLNIYSPGNGGSGGGGAVNLTGGTGTSGQGNAGGNNLTGSLNINTGPTSKTQTSLGTGGSGGGAGSAGQASAYYNGVQGGSGIYCSLDGIRNLFPYYWGGGGGSGKYGNGRAGLGGLGGGGSGTNNSEIAGGAINSNGAMTSTLATMTIGGQTYYYAGNGAPNSGGGGGGGATTKNTGLGGSGGSGIIIMAIPTTTITPYGPPPLISGITATGSNTLVTDTSIGYRIYTFLTDGTFSFTNATNTVLYILAVGGGGAGTSQYSTYGGGGGGGGGGMVESAVMVNGACQLTINIGAGSIGAGAGNTMVTFGDPYSAYNIVAYGGGDGSTFGSNGQGVGSISNNGNIYPGNDGGCGGGLMGNYLVTGLLGGSNGIQGYGCPIAPISTNANNPSGRGGSGGGGGGAGGPSVWVNTSNGYGNPGGPGKQSILPGISTYYSNVYWGGGGGGAASYNANQPSACVGGIGGGGAGWCGSSSAAGGAGAYNGQNGGSSTSTAAGRGAFSSGGGGGGGSNNNGNGGGSAGFGGSGIVVIAVYTRSINLDISAITVPPPTPSLPDNLISYVNVSNITSPTPYTVTLYFSGSYTTLTLFDNSQNAQNTHLFTNITSSNFTVNGLLANTPYKFTVIPYDPLGVQGTPVVSPVCYTLPYVNISAATIVGNAVSVSFASTDAGSYDHLTVTVSTIDVRSGFTWYSYNSYHSENPNIDTTASLINGVLGVSSGSITDFTNLNSSTNNNWLANQSQHNFSIIWKGLLYTKGYSGSWSFQTASDDGSYMWLGNTALTGYTRSNALIDNGNPHGMRTISANITLNSYTYYPIRIMFGESGGGYDMQFRFTPPGQSQTADGTGFFFTENNSGTTIFTATNVTESSYKYTGILPNTVYTLIVTPYNAVNAAGAIMTTPAVYSPATVAYAGPPSVLTQNSILIPYTGFFKSLTISNGSTSVTGISGITGSYLTYNIRGFSDFVKTANGYFIYVFTKSIANAIDISGAGNMYILAVGGGGSGGTNASGGGGGGGVVQQTVAITRNETISINIGTGGKPSINKGNNGGDTSLTFSPDTNLSITAFGGGAGGSATYSPGNGGSGGGAGGYNTGGGQAIADIVAGSTTFVAQTNYTTVFSNGIFYFPFDVDILNKVTGSSVTASFIGAGCQLTSFCKVGSGALQSAGATSSSSYLKLNTIPANRNGYSFAFWVYISNSATGIVWSFSLNSNNSTRIYAYYNSGTFYFGTTNGNSITVTTVYLNTWYHIAWTLDKSSNSALYLNGNILSVVNTAPYVSAAFDKNYILSDPYGSSNPGIYGYIDEFYYFDTILLSDNISSIYTSGTYVTTPGTVVAVGGNNGGSSSANGVGGGGGGGAGNAGGSSTALVSGNGGNGIVCTLPGISSSTYSSYYWAGGGGGSSSTGSSGGNGGLGGGGGAANYSGSVGNGGGNALNAGENARATGVAQAGGNAGANTGGGGGGASLNSGYANGGAGGDGIVIVALPPPSLYYIYNNTFAANTPYTFTLTPYNIISVAGNVVTLPPIYTWGSINACTLVSYYPTSIDLSFSGSYSYVTISNGTNSIQNISGTIYRYTNLISNKLYTFSIIPYNVSNISGTPFVTTSIYTLPSLVNVNIVPYSSTGLTVNWTGAFNTVVISIAANSPTNSLTTYSATSLSPFYISGLAVNSPYYVFITPYNRSNFAGNTYAASVAYTQPTVSVDTPYATSAYSINIPFTGNFYNVSIFNGVSTTVTGISGSLYSFGGLLANTQYNFAVTPYNRNNNAGTPVNTLSIFTFGNVFIQSAYATSTSSVLINYTGQYQYVSIANNVGKTFAQVYTASPFIFSKLNANTPYTFSFVPYNNYGVAGNTITTATVYTQPVVQFNSFTSITANIANIYFSGQFNTVSITGSSNYAGNAFTAGNTFTGIGSSPFAFSGLLPNVSYTFAITPYNAQNVAGNSVSSSSYTAPTFILGNVMANSSTSVSVPFSGIYDTVTIDNSAGVVNTGITVSPYNFTGLTQNTFYNFNVTRISSGVAGNTLTLPAICTWGEVTSITAQNVNGTPNVSIAFTGTYSTVSITNNAGNVYTGITSSPFLYPNLDGSSNYTFTITPYNQSNIAGTSVNTTPLYSTSTVTAYITNIYDTAVLFSFYGYYSSISITNTTTGNTVTGITASPYLFTGLSVNTSYNFTLAGYNGAGVVGNTFTYSVSTTVYGQIYNATASSSSAINIYFAGVESSVGISTTQLTVSGSPVVSGITTSPYTYTGLSPNVGYTFYVYPYNSLGMWSSTNYTQTLTVYTWAAVTGVTFSVSGTVQMIIATVTGRFTGIYWRNLVTGTTSGYIAGANTVIINDTSVAYSTYYNYNIIPVNSAGYSPANFGSPGTYTTNFAYLVNNTLTTSSAPNFTIVSTLNNIATTAYNSCQGAYGCILLNGNYTGPVLQLRSPNDTTQSNLTDFYADTNGKLTTGPNGTGTSVAAWSSSPYYAYVTKWYDQSNVTANHATQTTTTSQPVYDIANKLINFGYSGGGGGYVANYTSLAYLNLPNSALPYNDTPFTYVTKVFNLMNTNGYSLFVGGGGAMGSGEIYFGTRSNLTQLDCYANSLDTYATYNWIPNTVVSFIYDNGNISGTRQHRMYTNGNILFTASPSARAQVNYYNYIGGGNSNSGVQSNATLNGQMYYLYVFGSVLSNVDRAIVESTAPTIMSGGSSSGSFFGANVVDTSQNAVGIEFAGYYTSLSIYNNTTGVTTNNVGIATNPYYLTGLVPRTQYTFTIVPYYFTNIINNAIFNVTATTATSFSLGDLKDASNGNLYLPFFGKYTTVTISLGPANVISGIASSPYILKALLPDTVYNVSVTPYVSGVAGNTITKSPIYPTCFINDMTINNYTATTSTITVSYTGIYSTLSIVAGNAAPITGITTPSYTFTSLSPGTQYAFQLTPYDASGKVGNTVKFNASTLPTITYGNVIATSATTISLSYDGGSTYLGQSYTLLDVSTTAYPYDSARTPFVVGLSGNPYVFSNIYTNSTTGVVATPLTPNTTYPSFYLYPYNNAGVINRYSYINVPSVYTWGMVTSAYYLPTLSSITLYVTGSFSAIAWQNTVTGVVGNTIVASNNTIIVDVSNLIPFVNYNYNLIPYNTEGFGPLTFGASGTYTLANVIIKYGHLNLISVAGAQTCQGAYACFLVNNNYTGPVIQLRNFSDATGSSVSDFYSDICGNMTTGPNKTGITLKQWLADPRYAFVSKWYDQSVVTANHATQNNVKLQPVFDVSWGLINFGYVGNAGGFIGAVNNNSFFNLPNGALPAGNLSYTITSKHGNFNVTTNSSYQAFVAGGAAVYGSALGLYAYDICGGYAVDWYGYQWSTNPSYVTPGNIITSQYSAIGASAGTSSFYINSNQVNSNVVVASAAVTPAVRQTATTNNSIGRQINWTGGAGDNYYFTGQMYYLYVFGSALSTYDRRVIESTRRY